MRVERRPRFLDDLTEFYRYLRRQSPQAAERMLDDVERVVGLLSAFPEAGRLRPELNCRAFPVRRFRYVIFYAVQADCLALSRFLFAGRRLSAELLAEK